MIITVQIYLYFYRCFSGNKAFETSVVFNVNQSAVFISVCVRDVKNDLMPHTHTNPSLQRCVLSGN